MYAGRWLPALLPFSFLLALCFVTSPGSIPMDMKTSPLTLLNDPTLLKTDGLINGQWVAGSSRFDVNDPATGRKLADVANLGPQDAEAAIAAANAPGLPGKPRPPRSAASSCASGLTCSWPIRTTWAAS
jgi:hypothetical protein